MDPIEELLEDDDNGSNQKVYVKYSPDQFYILSYYLQFNFILLFFMDYA